MSRTLLDIIGEDIIGAIFRIGNIHAHQLKNGEWHAYIVAGGHPEEYEYQKHEREKYVKEYMSGRHIYLVKDVNGFAISGATRKELVKKIKRNAPTWLLLDAFWTQT